MVKSSIKQELYKVTETAKVVAKSKITWSVLLAGVVLLSVLVVMGIFLYKKYSKKTPENLNVNKIETESQAKLPPTVTANSVGTASSSEGSSINNNQNSAV
jgi:uncharacterized membrane protein